MSKWAARTSDLQVISHNLRAGNKGLRGAFFVFARRGEHSLCVSGGPAAAVKAVRLEGLGLIRPGEDSILGGRLAAVDALAAATGLPQPDAADGGPGLFPSMGFAVAM